MKGSGTQTDPYIVDNWEEFVTIDTSSAEIYVRWADTENKVINFNHIMPEGFSETVNFPAHVDFNGWTLRNFHSTAIYSFKVVSSTSSLVENLIFENFYVTSQYLMYGSFLLKNCIISGISQYRGNNIFLSGCGLQSCSVNLNANASGYFTFMNGSGFTSPKSQIANSDIILDISCTSDASIGDIIIKNSRISGKIQANASSITLGNSSSMSNVFNIDSNCPLKYSSSAISIFNSDMSEKSSDNNKNFLGVSAEQLKNAEYLYSIGFPIGVD